MSGASLVNMSYGHLAAAFPVGSPGLPTPPQVRDRGSEMDRERKRAREREREREREGDREKGS